MNIIIVGCGRIGADLAYRLYLQGHQVTVVDNVPQAFERLNPDFHGRTVEGEALSKEVLERAGITSADGLAAVANSDTLNASVAHIAQSIFKLSNVVVRNYDPKLRSVLEAFGFQIISSSAWGAQRTEELLTSSKARALFSPGNGEVEIYEIAITGKWVGRSIKDLFHDINTCVPVALTRSGRSALPDSNQSLALGDILTISATAQGEKLLRSRIIGEEV